MFTGLVQKSRKLAKPQRNRINKCTRQLKFVNANVPRTRTTDCITNRIVNSQIGAGFGRLESVIKKNVISGLVVDSGSSLEKKHLKFCCAQEYDSNDSNKKLQKKDTPKRDTFYTKIALVLDQNGPLPVSTIYKKIYDISPPNSLNKNWKNSVRHALSSKVLFFKRDGKKDSGRGHKWALIMDYPSICLRSAQRIQTRGIFKGLSESSARAAKNEQDHHDKMSKYYHIYFNTLANSNNIKTHKI